MFGGFFGALGGGYFDQNFRAYPVAFIEKESAENGDKVILPPSSLNTLASMHVEYPMLFRVENKRGQRVSHCGVLEFISQEGMVYMPNWMMENLLLSEGDLVNLKNVSLPKGSFIKIQPHTSDFLDITNPKAVLETSLRSFTCLTKDDTIAIPYNGKKYYIDIIEVKPDTAVSVVETDVEVDFAPPKDYKEPDYKAMQAASKAQVAPAVSNPSGPNSGAQAAPGNAEEEPTPPAFTAFSGRGNRIDGKALLQRAQEPAARSISDEGASTSTQSGGQGGGLKSGTVVFGDSQIGSGSATQPSIPGNRLAARLANKQQGQKAAPTAPKKDPVEEPKFVAFQGKGRSLKG